MSNRLRQNRNNSEPVSTSSRIGNFTKKHPRATAAVAGFTLAGLVGGGLAIKNHNQPTDHQARQEKTYSVEQLDHMDKAVEAAVHRFDACTITGVGESTQKPPYPWPILRGPQDEVERTSVAVNFTVERNPAAAPFIEEFYNKTAVEWDPAALRVRVLPAGASESEELPAPPPQDAEHGAYTYGYGFEDKLGGTADTSPVDLSLSVFSPRQAPGAKLEFFVHNSARMYVNKESQGERQRTQFCGSATLQPDGQWQLDMPANK